MYCLDKKFILTFNMKYASNLQLLGCFTQKKTQQRSVGHHHFLDSYIPALSHEIRQMYDQVFLDNYSFLF